MTSTDDLGPTSTRLQQISVFGLLGWFDHDVVIHPDWEFTIVHGPNGVGKTKLLELTAGALSLQPIQVVRIPFDRAIFRFSEGSSLEVTREGGQAQLPLEAEEVLDASGSLAFRLHHHDSDPIEWMVRPELPTRLSPPMRQRLERVLPIERLTPDIWLDRRTGEHISLSELAERFPEDIPFAFDSGPAPSEMRDFLASIPAHLIETQRLTRQVHSDSRRPMNQQSTVLAFAEDLTRRIGSALAENSRRSQTLDRTFPGRILGVHGPLDVSDQEIRERYDAQSSLRESLAELAVLDSSPELSLPDRELEQWERLVLWTYLDDAEQKLSTFLDLLSRVRLLREIISARFLFKEILIDREDGFRFLTLRGDEISARSLSSGEQQEIVLVYELLFNVPPGSLVLIDEPEISLHVAWQKAFLDDIRRIAELRNLRFLIATHSPQIINRWWDRTISLYTADDGEFSGDVPE